MGLITDLFDGLFGIRAEANPNDERFWVSSEVATVLSQSGVAINGKTALKVSCLFQGTRIRSETVAGLPLKIHRKLPGGGHEEARDHRLWKTLRRRPNAWQTAFEFRQLLTAWSILYGIGAARKKPGSRGFADELVPLDPERLSVLQNSDDGERIFEYRRLDGTLRRYLQDEVFSINGFPLEPLVGAAILKLAREAAGLWLAREGFAARYFSQGLNPNMVMKLSKNLDPEAVDKYREYERLYNAGNQNAHRSMLLQPVIADFKEFKGKTARDAQLSETIESIVLDFARWLNVPKHMLHSGEQPTYASAEQMAKEFVDFTVGPDAHRWEGSIDRDLLLDDADDDVFAEHLFDGLLRGNTKDRYAAYSLAVTGGWMTRNEVRQRENLNPLDGLDEPLTPLNMDRTGAGDDETDDTPPPPPRRRPTRRDDQDDDTEETATEAAALAVEAAGAATAAMTATLDAAAPPPAVPRRLALIAEESARQVVGKELARFRDQAKKLAGKPAAWRSAVVDFYSNHAALVAQRLQLEPAVARRYCDAQRDELLTAGAAALERWPDTAVRTLTDLALEEIRHEDRAA